MDSHSVFPFLRLPAELRLEIYKHVWTVPEADYYVYRPSDYDHDSEDSELRLSVDYLTAQLSAIRKLGAISQRIRTESYSEYFDHTQIMLRYDSAMDTEAIEIFGGLRWWDDRNRSALYIIASSYLLQTQARHVYLHWPALPVYRGFQMQFGSVHRRVQEELLNEQWAVECLSRFRNLKSLEVHVNNGSPRVIMAHWWKEYVHKLWHPDSDPDYKGKKELKRLFYDDERRAKLIEALKTHHRKLEKAVVRTDLTGPEDVKLMDEHKAFRWWRRLKKDIAVLASEGPSSAEGEKEDTYVFKQHIGSLKLC